MGLYKTNQWYSIGWTDFRGTPDEYSVLAPGLRALLDTGVPVEVALNAAEVMLGEQISDSVREAFLAKEKKCPNQPPKN